MLQRKQDFINYIGFFFALYIVSCVALGAIAVTLAFIIVGVFGFGLGFQLTASETDALGPLGIGMSLSFLVSMPIALVGTIWVAPTEKNIRRDFDQQNWRMGRYGRRFNKN